MKFGLCVPNFGAKISPQDLVTLATTAEEGGFDGVFVTDHVIVPPKEREPYGQLMEALVTLTYISAKTRTIRLGTSILVIPQRNPVLVAKQVATLDQFSGGRVILGLGAGWMEDEFRFLNANFRRRGRVFDESIEFMRKLWSEESVTHSGRSFNVKDAIFLPKPFQARVPIWIGGASDSALERAAKLGDGWHPVGIDPARLALGVQRLKKSGRKLTVSLRITTDVRKKRDDYVSATGEKRVALSGNRQEIVSKLEEYKGAGLDYAVPYIFRDTAEEIVEDIRKFSSDVIRSYN